MLIEQSLTEDRSMQSDNLKKKKENENELSMSYNTLSLKKKSRNKIFIQQSFKSCSRVQSLQKNVFGYSFYRIKVLRRS